MRHLLAVAIIVAMSVSPSLAQDLSLPAVEGQGGFTQTLDVAKDAVVVTIDAGGSFNTHTGKVDTNVSVDVHGMSVGVGSVPGTEPPGPSAPIVDVDTGDNGHGKMVGNMVTPGVNGAPALGHAMEAQIADGVCHDEVGEPMSARAIEQLQEDRRVMLQLACTPAELDAAQRQALADNAALSGFLEARNVPLNDVVSITILREIVILSLEQQK